MAVTKINSAVAIAPRTVRVTFDGAHATTLTTPWTLSAGGTGPYYTPTEITTVGVDDPTTPFVVDVTLDQEPTPGVLYTITCTGVTGVAVDGIHNIGLFWALTPAAPSTRDYSIIDLIPPVNIAEDYTGDLSRFVACLQEVANLLWSDIDSWGDIFDINKAPANFVDIILAQLGCPVELPDLTTTEKRKLCAVLVDIYKIKGSIPGLTAAIKFFVGLPAQVTNFFGMGAQLGAAGVYLGAGGGDQGTWILGGGNPWAFTVKCATPGGVALTGDQVTRVAEIVNKTKPAVSRVDALSASYVAPMRLDIKDNGAGSVTLTCAAVTGATSFQTFYRSQPGVNEWNGTVLALVGTGPATATLTPAPGQYWAACVNNTATGVPGLLTNEVTNTLTTPVLTATPQTRNIHLSWPAVAGAMSYRIYRSTTAKTRPSAADNAPNPIRVNTNSYDDPMEFGRTFYYIVVPMAGDAESFYSNEAHGTSL